MIDGRPVEPQVASDVSAPHRSTARADGSVERMPRYAGVEVRLLREDERPYPAQDPSYPLVIEAGRDRGIEYVQTFLASRGAEVVNNVHQYGAVLLRGFDVLSEEGFGKVVASVPGFKPMTGYFMAEAGRTRVQPSSMVFHTNAHYRTGSSFSQLGNNFHSENYYSIDFPTFQCFWCKQPSRLGGETGLGHMSRAYAELDRALRERLERCVCTVNAWAVETVAERYSVSVAFVERFFAELGLPVVTEDDHRYLVLPKPHVFDHPQQGSKSLQANLCGELPEVSAVLYRLLLPHYSDLRWALHRFAWRHPRVRELLAALDTVPRMLLHPAVAAHYLRTRIGSRLLSGLREENQRLERIVSRERLSKKLAKADMEALAHALWRHTSVFRWRRGDVLLIDNLQVMHAGMPGAGPRELRAMLCNPIAFEYPVGAGPARIRTGAGHAAVDERLNAQSRGGA